MIFGLSPTHTKILQDIFKQHLKRGLVIIYGSRVKNTQTKYIVYQTFKMMSVEIGLL